MTRTMNLLAAVLFTASLFYSMPSAAQRLSSAAIEFPANSPEIRFQGRTAVNSDGSVSFDWSGVYCEFAFTGDYCAVRGSDDPRCLNRFNLFVDGIQTAVVNFSTDSTVVLFADVASGPGASGAPGRGSHQIRLQKRTEGNQGIFTLKKIILPEGERLEKSAPAPDRRILFIGNSLTCGYGVEAKSNKERFNNLTENCNLSYACDLARYFDADYELISHSGIGAARNYGDKRRVSKKAMPEAFARTFDSKDDSAPWNFGNDPFRPDVVVIYLGTNDFSTKPWPTYKEFSKRYYDIVRQVRAAYGDVPILCVSTYLIDPALDYTRRIVESGKSSNLHLAAILPGYCNPDTDHGADGHPNIVGQQKTAMLLAPYISTLTGWPVNAKRGIE
jgi:lysophospholipase L1-like esterase